MSLPPEIQNLIGQSDIGIEQKIVEELLNENSNLEAKTELTVPVRWSCLKIIQEFLEGKNLKYSEKILTRFIKITFKYLISKDRKGRLEYLEALKGLQQRDNQLIPPSNSMLTDRNVLR